MQGLGSGAISLFGSNALREAYLPRVAQGEAIAAFALSEKEAGSDVAKLDTTARNDAGAYVIDGAKTWISNGGIADFYVVFARTGEAPGAKGLSAFVVDAANPGMRVSERIDVIAPHPLAALGRALDAALDRSTTRELFGSPLATMQTTQNYLAEMALEIDASALLVFRSAWSKDCRQDRVTREAAMAKLHATESAQRIIDLAVQLHGGQGVVTGETVERLYREIRALRIYEGASEVQKMIIARQTLSAYAAE